MHDIHEAWTAARAVSVRSLAIVLTMDRRNPAGTYVKPKEEAMQTLVKNKSRKRRLLVLAAVIAALVTSIVGTTTYAQADDFQTQANASVGVTHLTPGYAGKIIHVDNGDEFNVQDLERDGYGAKGLLWNSSQTTIIRSAYATGAGTGEWFQYDIESGKTYYLQVCLQKDGKSFKCSNKVTIHE